MLVLGYQVCSRGFLESVCLIFFEGMSLLVARELWMLPIDPVICFSCGARQILVLMIYSDRADTLITLKLSEFRCPFSLSFDINFLFFFFSFAMYS